MNASGARSIPSPTVSGAMQKRLLCDEGME
jgi:hypothetical protein